MSRAMQIILLVLAVSGLILIRQFAGDIFYDPLIEFFKTDHSTQPLPELMTGKLLLHITIRFFFNTVLSFLVLWVIFKSRSILKLALFLYITLFLIFVIAFAVMLNTSEAGNHMALFYVRRFLIQPLFLLLLLPAFYFHKRS
ncbi:MAG: exosortase F system-associated protein [Flavobacteriaceae bacterium]|nr:exosortase F system-associated protein [Flavobacteriaceae bacterium]